MVFQKPIRTKALLPKDVHAEGPGGLSFLSKILLDEENNESSDSEVDEPQGERSVYLIVI